MKKNRIVSMFLGTAMFLGLASCSEDQTTLSESGNKMTFTSNVLSTKTTNADLQAAQIASGVQAGVFVGDDYANSLLTADGAGNFATAEDMVWPEESVNIYAYAPYDEEWSDISSEVEFTVAADQSTDEGYLSSDLLVGAPESNPVAPTAESVTLKFAHKLAKLNVSVVNNNSGIDLMGASLSVVNLLPSASVNVTTGVLGEAAGTAGDIKMAAFAADATEFQASAIIVPQTVSAGNFVQIVTSDNRVLNAALKSEVTFAGNKKYTYTVKISGSGADDVEVALVLGSELGDWEDGNTDLEGDAEEVVEYLVGDYVLADGTFAKASEVASMTAEQKANVAGVIFSTEVSATDAAAGYAGYAMSVNGTTSGNWSSNTTDLVYEAITDLSVAFSYLDGLDFMQKVKAKDNTFATYPGFNFSGYTPELTSEKLSEWYVPSFGQQMQILNNLAEAGLTSDTSDYTNSNNEYNISVTVAEKLNEVIAKVNADVAAFEHTGQFYAAATEHGAGQIWGVKLTNEGIAISRYAGKDKSRSFIPVFAFKELAHYTPDTTVE